MNGPRAVHQLAFRRYTRPSPASGFPRASSAIFLKYDQVLGENSRSKCAKIFFVYLERLIDERP